MRIALIRKKFAVQGGAERHVSDFVATLAKEGHEVHIFASEWEALEGVIFHHVPILSLGSFFKTLSFHLNLRRKLSGESFDIIQSNERTYPQDIYRAGDGCHREWLAQRGRYVSPWKKALIKVSPFHLLMLFMERKIFSKVNYKKIIAISEMGKKEIMAHYGVPSDAIKVIYNGVDLGKFKPAEGEERERIRRKFDVYPEERLLLFVGSGFERKGLLFLLQALGRLGREKVKLLVVGKGRHRKYRPMLKSLGIEDKVTFAGVIREREEIFKGADAFVFPSIYEPFGNVHLEALAAGLPVITTAKSGAAEIITPQVNGFVVEEPSDIEEIVRSIRILLDDETRKKMGREARKLAERFPLEKNAGEILDLYREVLKMLQTP